MKLLAILILFVEAVLARGRVGLVTSDKADNSTADGAILLNIATTHIHGSSVTKASWIERIIMVLKNIKI